MVSELAEDFKGIVELKNAEGQVITKNMVRTDTPHAFSSHANP